MPESILWQIFVFEINFQLFCALMDVYYSCNLFKYGSSIKLYQMCLDSADIGGNDKFVIARITTLNSMFANLTMFLL